MTEKRYKRQCCQHNWDKEQPAVTPVNLKLDVLFVERYDGRPAGLSGFCEDFPIGDDGDDEIRHNQQPKGAENAENGIQSRSF